MADRVIICGLRRGGEVVPQTEILQMAGRCGRTASSLSSPAVFLLSEDQDLPVAEKYLYSKPPSIASTLTDTDRIMFHVLPDICSGKIVDSPGVQKWFDRSLAMALGWKLSVEEVITSLIETGMVSVDGVKITPMPLAKIAVGYLFHPRVVQRWVEKVEEVITSERLEDNVSLAWLLARQGQTCFSPKFDILEEFTSMCDAYGYDMVTGEAMSGLVYYCILTQQRPAAMKYQIYEYKDDAPRLLSAIKKLDELRGWGKKKTWDRLRLQLTQSVDGDAAELMQQMGIMTKSLAVQLTEMGYKTREDIVAGIDTSDEVSDSQLLRRVKEIL